MSHDAIPHYDLYGEPAQGAKADFLHLEMLEERSGPSNWKIRPHRHGDLHQVFLVTSGAGSISLDGASTDLPAPFLVLAPAGSVHAFTWPAGSEGFVLTVSDPLLRALLAPHPELETLFAQGFWRRPNCPMRWLRCRRRWRPRTPIARWRFARGFC